MAAPDNPDFPVEELFRQINERFDGEIVAITVHFKNYTIKDGLDTIKCGNERVTQFTCFVRALGWHAEYEEVSPQGTTVFVRM
jgi:hypothetical protein